ERGLDQDQERDQQKDKDKEKEKEKEKEKDSKKELKKKKKKKKKKKEKENLNQNQNQKEKELDKEQVIYKKDNLNTEFDFSDDEGGEFLPVVNEEELVLFVARLREDVSQHPQRTPGGSGYWGKDQGGSKKDKQALLSLQKGNKEVVDTNQPKYIKYSPLLHGAMDRMDIVMQNWRKLLAEDSYIPLCAFTEKQPYSSLGKEQRKIQDRLNDKDNWKIRGASSRFQFPKTIIRPRLAPNSSARNLRDLRDEIEDVACTVMEYVMESNGEVAVQKTLDESRICEQLIAVISTLPHSYIRRSLVSPFFMLSFLSRDSHKYMMMKEGIVYTLVEILEDQDELDNDILWVAAFALQQVICSCAHRDTKMEEERQKEIKKKVAKDKKEKKEKQDKIDKEKKEKELRDKLLRERGETIPPPTKEELEAMFQPKGEISNSQYYSQYSIQYFLNLATNSLDSPYLPLVTDHYYGEHPYRMALLENERLLERIERLYRESCRMMMGKNERGMITGGIVTTSIIVVVTSIIVVIVIGSYSLLITVNTITRIPIPSELDKMYKLKEELDEKELKEREEMKLKQEKEFEREQEDKEKRYGQFGEKEKDKEEMKEEKDDNKEDDKGNSDQMKQGESSATKQSRRAKQKAKQIEKEKEKEKEKENNKMQITKKKKGQQLTPLDDGLLVLNCLMEEVSNMKKNHSANALIAISHLANCGVNHNIIIQHPMFPSIMKLIDTEDGNRLIWPINLATTLIQNGLKDVAETTIKLLNFSTLRKIIQSHKGKEMRSAASVLLAWAYDKNMMVRIFDLSEESEKIQEIMFEVRKDKIEKEKKEKQLKESQLSPKELQQLKQQQQQQQQQQQTKDKGLEQTIHIINSKVYVEQKTEEGIVIFPVEEPLDQEQKDGKEILMKLKKEGKEIKEQNEKDNKEKEERERINQLLLNRDENFGSRVAVEIGVLLHKVLNTEPLCKARDMLCDALSLIVRNDTKAASIVLSRTDVTAQLIRMLYEIPLHLIHHVHVSPLMELAKLATNEQIHRMHSEGLLKSLVRLLQHNDKIIISQALRTLVIAMEEAEKTQLEEKLTNLLMEQFQKLANVSLIGNEGKSKEEKEKKKKERKERKEKERQKLGIKQPIKEDEDDDDDEDVSEKSDEGEKYQQFTKNKTKDHPYLMELVQLNTPERLWAIYQLGVERCSKHRDPHDIAMDVATSIMFGSGKERKQKEKEYRTSVAEVEMRDLAARALNLLNGNSADSLYELGIGDRRKTASSK
ncbi:MAG: hypothetical protein EZS28_019173, partial [Streblomastix strix]